MTTSDDKVEVAGCCMLTNCAKEDNSVIIISDSKDSSCENEFSSVLDRCFSSVTDSTSTSNDESSIDCSMSLLDSLRPEGLLLNCCKPILGSSEKLCSKYHFDRELFENKNTTVLIGKNKQTNSEVAVKIFKLSVDYKKYLEEGIPKEVFCQKMAEKVSVHKGTVLKVLDWYVHLKHIVIVTEYSSDFKSLTEYMLPEQSTTWFQRERECKNIFKVLYALVCKLNNNGIFHHDLKPGNILYNEKTKELKLIDFGHAICRDPGENGRIRRTCGTPGLRTPEQAKKGFFHRRDADVWGVGQTAFSFLQGEYPFENDQEVLNKKLEFTVRVSNDCKDFFCRLFAKKKENRMTEDEILNHPWLKKKNVL